MDIQYGKYVNFLSDTSTALLDSYVTSNHTEFTPKFLINYDFNTLPCYIRNPYIFLLQIQ